MEKLKNIPYLRFPEFDTDWEVKKLKEVADIGRGKSKHRPRDAEFLYGGKYPFIQTGDIRKAGLYLTEFTQTYSEEGLKQSKLWLEDTLCITIAANIAETSILKIKACFPDSIIGLIPSENKTTVLFVKHLFDKFKIQIQSLSQGAAQDNLNQEKLSNIEFIFPELIEQTKIAKFLTTIEDRLQALKQKKTLLEQYKKGVMQKIFSQELRFKDDNGNEYPDWEEKKLGDIVKEYNVKSIVNDQYVVLSSSMGGIKLQSDYFTKDISSKDNTGYKIVPKGYFTYRSMSDTGSFTFNIQNIVDIGIVSPAYPVFKTIDSIVSEYLSFYLNNSNKIINDLLGLKEGGTRYALSFSKFSRLEVILPSLQEQTKIANFLSTIDEKINYCQSQIEKTEFWKKGLLQQMFC